jgi:alpha-tubulin suppressor-like RCC1 family protein
MRRRWYERTIITLAAAATVAVSACSPDYPAQPAASAAIEAVAWPDTITDTDTTALQVRVVTASGVVVTGTAVEWSSSDPSTLSVTPGEPTDTTVRNRLAAPLRASAIARRTGAVTVSVSIPTGGPLLRATFEKSIVISQHWTSISAGYRHTCGVTIRNDVYCWGGTGTGASIKLGNGSSAGSTIPSRVIGGIQFRAVTAGAEHSCGASLEGQLFCWGDNQAGAIGNGTTLPQFSPAAVFYGVSFKSVAAGAGYTCAVSIIDTAVCWGDDTYGQLASASPLSDCGSSRCSLVPDTVATGTGVLRALAITTAERHTCAIALDRHAVCWGDNTLGNLGDGTANNSAAPVSVSSATSFTSISAGANHTCALSTDGRVFCWGTNLYGELGGGAAVGVCDGLPCSRTPMAVPGSRTYRAVSVRGRSSCAISADSTAYCWGLNDRGQIGATVGLTTCTGRPCATTPVAVAGLAKIVAISVGARHACAVAVTGAAYCWGQNVDGELGIGGTTDAPRPLRVNDPR